MVLSLCNNHSVYFIDSALFVDDFFFGKDNVVFMRCKKLQELSIRKETGNDFLYRFREGRKMIFRDPGADACVQEGFIVLRVECGSVTVCSE